MNSTVNLTLPRDVLLRDKTGWKRSPLNPDIYFVVRCHFSIRTRQEESSEIRLGNIVNSFNATAGVLEEITHSIEYNQEIGLVGEALEQHLLETLSQESFTKELGLHMNAHAIASLSMANKVLATRNFKESLTRSDRIQMTRTQSRKITTTRKYTIQASDPTRDTQYLVAEAYVRYAADVHLTFIDYLNVSYRKSRLGNRYTTLKSPEVVDGKHPNIDKIGAPLLRVLFWKPLDALVTVPMGKYRNSVGNPLDLEIVPIPEATSPYAPISPSPTLYELASEAFPGRPSKAL